MRNQKLRFVLVVPYLTLTGALFFKAYFFSPDYSTFLLSVSDFFLMLLLSPWIFIVSAVAQIYGLDGNLVGIVGTVGSVALNAAILYYVGLKFEKAPDSLLV